MKMKYIIGMFIVLTLSLSAFAGVKEKKALKSGQKGLDDYQKYIKKECGFKVPATLDKKSYKNLEAANTAGWAENSMFAIKSLCGDTDYKEAIKESVKKVKFVYTEKLDKEKNYGNAFALKAGVWTISYNKDTANMGQEALKWLKDNL